MPVPGGPIKREDHARTAVLGHAALGAQLADRQVLGDAPLHVVEAFVVGVEHLARVHRIEPLLGSLRPRHRQQPVEIGADHAPTRRSSRPSARDGTARARPAAARRRACRRSAIFCRYSSDDGAVALAKLLADGVHLLAQEVLALLLLRAVFDVVADALADLQLGEPIPLELQRQRQPLDDVERFEELDLLGEVQVGRIAGGIGQRAGVGDRPHERADPAVVAAQLENLVDDRAVFALELAGEAGRRRLVGTRLDVDAQHAVGVGRGAAGHRAMQRRQRHGEPAAGQPHALGHFGDDADLRVGVVAASAPAARGRRCPRRPAA